MPNEPRRTILRFRRRRSDLVRDNSGMVMSEARPREPVPNRRHGCSTLGWVKRTRIAALTSSSGFLGGGVRQLAHTEIVHGEQRQGRQYQ